MALKPRTPPARTPAGDEATPTVTSRERTPPVTTQPDPEDEKSDTERDLADTERDEGTNASDREEDDKDSTPASEAPRRQRATTPSAAPTSSDPKGTPKERLVEIRRELKALNSEELGARKALDAEYGARRKALRSEYDLLTRQETAALFGDEPDA